MKTNLNRRNFIKRTALVGAGIAMAPNLVFSKPLKKESIKLGFIGVGGRGRTHLRNALARTDVKVVAICDIDPKAIEASQKMIAKAGQKADAYTKHEKSYLDLLARKDIDGVVISTPWLWHTKMAVDSMKAGKYTGVEVSAANTMEECWDLVNTYEQTKSPLMILENVCYRRDVLAALNMVKKGLFGEPMHFTCGYRHDLRHVKFTGVDYGKGSHGEARWRTQHSLLRNGDLYPTHGIGPIATYLDINKGNRFVSLTSTATKARGLSHYVSKHPKGGPDHPNAKANWKLGDVVTTVIKTAREESIIVTHDTNLARPYSLDFSIQGTEGLMEFDYYKQRIHIEGKSKAHQWEEGKPYLEKYDHPLWKNHEKKAAGSGHGGMDFFVMNAFVECIKREEAAPLDAYDAAAWSAITPLSEISIANNSEVQDFPDFTRGNWIKRKPDFGTIDY
jgi:predicted dehydrogenase